ncbi:MAG: biotin synthase, partial [Sphingomonadales bacterium]
ADVGRLTVSIRKIRPFIVASDWRPIKLSDKADIRELVAPKAEQMELFAA